MSERRVNDLLYKFYAAGYEDRSYPRPLSHVAVRVRRPLRRAYREGKTERRFIARLGRVLYGG